MKTKIFVFIYIFFFLYSASIKAVSILDYEIKIFITDIIYTISRVNKYEKKISFEIILDDHPNAFINEKNKLFISTGLLKYAETYEAIVAVLAHELGHLEKFHISKRKKSIKKLKKINQITSLSIIAGSLISNNSNYLIESLISKQAGIQNYYLSFSRNQEREADYYGIKTLEKLQLSKIPLIKFLNLIERKAIQSGFKDEYSKFSTHPIFKERYSLIENSQKNTNLNFDNILNQRFNYIKAKLFGFTERDTIDLKQHLKGSYFIYASSIILSRQGKLKAAMQKLNKLLELNNFNYYFLLETKADILYSNGFLTESLLFYKKVIKNYPDNHYIKKRIFDIKFINNNINNKIVANDLFNKYSFLLNIFYNNVDLNNKFSNLAKTSKKYDWVNYFLLQKSFLSDSRDINKYIKNITIIKEDSSDIVLINLINKKIKIINEKN